MPDDEQVELVVGRRVEIGDGCVSEAEAPFSENTLVAVGKAFQARTDWHKRRPPGV